MRPVIYEPTNEDRAVCASVGEWHCTPEQRSALWRRADTITGTMHSLTKEDLVATDWVLMEDDSGNSAPLDALRPFRYTYGETGYAGALKWLVQIIEARMAAQLYHPELLRLYRAADLTPTGTGV